MPTPPYRRFIRFAPGKGNPSVSVPVRVTDMTARDAAWWDTRFGPHHLRIADRADRFWAWSVLLPACHLVQLFKRRYCRPLVIWARADSQRFMRVGMSIIIEQYPHLDVADSSDAHFVWFMCAADEGVLKSHFSMSNPPTLGRVLLDNAMVLSENLGLKGRIGLHATPAGGAALLALYSACGLLQLPKRARLPPPIKQSNDGRYFYTDEATAAVLLSNRDTDR